MAGLFGTPLDPEIQVDAKRQKVSDVPMLLSLIVASFCLLTALAFANGVWFLGIVLLVLVLPFSVAHLLVVGETVGVWAAVACAILLVSPVAAVTVAHFQQEGEIEKQYAAHCEVYRKGQLPPENYDAFAGWAARDRSDEEIRTWTVDNCSEESSDSSVSPAGDDKSDWSDCDKRVAVVAGYGGYSDEEERDLIEAIRADCDPTPGSANW
ncbi:hypothetical protein N5P18_04180 [Janibacter terrae]|uniref:Uncharacterized protein n=1 Tax=Janibacter terrae TaxID=103817 RepID=A0ABZ2FIX1_9MICO